MKKAFITGITGQDGSYLAEFLLAKGYEVHGAVRRSSSFNRARIEHLHVDSHDASCRLFLHYADLSDAGHLTNLLRDIMPDEVYNLGAQSHVKVSFDLPEYTMSVTGLGTVRMLEAIRRSNLDCRFYQASSSEMFGSALAPQNEDAPFRPRSPYACAKVLAHQTAQCYRDAYDMHINCGILFNHESPRRGESFVTRKITLSLANILAGKQKKLYVGNISAMRDWGFAPEYVEAMWTMLQQDKPGDYAIGTGITHTVEEFLNEAFSYAGLSYKDYIEIDPAYFRPLEADVLCADISKAKAKLNFASRVTFSELVKIMVDADMKLAGLTPVGESEGILQTKHFPWIDPQHL